MQGELQGLSKTWQDLLDQEIDKNDKSHRGVRVESIVVGFLAGEEPYSILAHEKMPPWPRGLTVGLAYPRHRPRGEV